MRCNRSRWLSRAGSGRRRGFTIIDILVSISVIALLLAIMAPTLWSVRETSKRVICGSNIRQLGIGIAMYADDWQDRLPPTQFLGLKKDKTPPAPHETIRLRVDASFDNVAMSGWDGLGYLYRAEYLPAPEIFYCPSHAGTNRFADNYETWRQPMGRILGNYQYRGKGPNGAVYLPDIRPGHAALVADGLRTFADFNHRVGGNVLRADLSVLWFGDAAGTMAGLLPHTDKDVKGETTDAAWAVLDEVK